MFVEGLAWSLGLSQSPFLVGTPRGSLENLQSYFVEKLAPH